MRMAINNPIQQQLLSFMAQFLKTLFRGGLVRVLPTRNSTFKTWQIIIISINKLESYTNTLDILLIVVKVKICHLTTLGSTRCSVLPMVTAEQA